MQTRADMEQVMLEAAKIDQMANSEGWNVIKQYCENTIRVSHDIWLYVDDDDKRVKELKQAARTAHAMINLVENFREEGKKLWTLWTRAQGLVPDVALDVDNASPNIEED